MKPVEDVVSCHPQTELRTASAVCRDRGISDTTLWRMGKRGDIRLVNIAGRCFVDMRSLADFDARALRGELAKKPSGAALKSTLQRDAKVAATEARP